MQLLHCLANATEGGRTSFTDGFAAAAALRRRDPEAFRLLATHAHPFEYRDPSSGVLLQAETPVLCLGQNDEVSRICFNNRSAGCLPPGALPDGEFGRYYAAWAAFDRLCNAEEHVLRVPLRPGDLAIFLNSRVMHGRESYTAGKGRHLQGCYLDHDAPRSRIAWGAASGGGGGGGGAAADARRFDVHWEATRRTMDALATQAEFCYGEDLNMLQHALQAAHCATLQGEAPDAVLAALTHDVGNSPQARVQWRRETGEESRLMVSAADQSIGYEHHADIGGAFLAARGFAAEVAGAVALHVDAKRALVAMDPGYMRELSQASVDTLAQQGGPLSPAELQRFNARPGAEVALRLRRYDDQGKDPTRDVPPLESYREQIYQHLRGQSAVASS